MIANNTSSQDNPNHPVSPPSDSSLYVSQYSTSSIAIIVFLMSLLSLLIILGNITVIYVYFTHRNLRIPKNFFILSLAVADILIGTISVNFYTVYLAHNRWPFGQVACDLWLAMDYSSCNASTLSLLAISVERYMSVRHIAFHRNKLTRVCLQRIIIALWIVSFSVWFSAIFIYPQIHGRRTLEEGKCYIQFLYENPFITIATAFVNFYGPIFIMATIYFMMSWTLMKRYKLKYHFNKDEQQTPDTIQPESSSSSEHITERGGRKSTIATIISDTQYSRVAARRKSGDSVLYNDTGAENITLMLERGNDVIIPKRGNTVDDDFANKRHSLTLSVIETPVKTIMRHKDYVTHKRAVTLLMLVIGAFAVTWFPYNLMAVMAPFCKKCIKDAWWHFGYIFCYVNSLLNPVCYAFGNRHFKKYFKEIFNNLKARILGKRSSPSVKNVII